MNCLLHNISYPWIWNLTRICQFHFNRGDISWMRRPWCLCIPNLSQYTYSIRSLFLGIGHINVTFCIFFFYDRSPHKFTWVTENSAWQYLTRYCRSHYRCHILYFFLHFRHYFFPQLLSGGHLFLSSSRNLISGCRHLLSSSHHLQYLTAVTFYLVAATYYLVAATYHLAAAT